MIHVTNLQAVKYPNLSSVNFKISARDLTEMPPPQINANDQEEKQPT